MTLTSLSLLTLARGCHSDMTPEPTQAPAPHHSGRGSTPPKSEDSSHHTPPHLQARLGRAETSFPMPSWEPQPVPLGPPPAPCNPQILQAWLCHPEKPGPRPHPPSPLRAKAAGPAGAAQNVRAHILRPCAGKGVESQRLPFTSTLETPLEPPSPDGLFGRHLLRRGNWKLRPAAAGGLVTQG